MYTVLADDNVNAAPFRIYVFAKVESMHVGKEENAGYQHFIMMFSDVFLFKVTTTGCCLFKG